jgi:hypothetical protein
MKNLNRKLALSGLLLAGLFTSCKKLEMADSGTPGLYSSGIFITNEGPFGAGTGTVSFLDRTKKTVSEDIFQVVNNRPLGNVVQSMEVIGDKAYIVVNNSNKIEVVNAATFTSSGSIKNLEFPRYIISGGNGKAYISQWSSTGSVAVLQLSNSQIIKTIPLASGPEHMLMKDNKLYVVCTGGFGSENILSVINTQTDQVVQTLVIGDSPNSLVLDANNKIWVLCGGKKVYEPAPSYALDTVASTAGSLYRISANTGAIETYFSFTSKSKLPSNLCINKSGDQLFFNGGDGVYTMLVKDSKLPNKSIVSKVFYTLGLDPLSGYLYGSDPIDYQGKGKIYKYAPDGTELDHFSAGVIPGNFTFR